MFRKYHIPDLPPHLQDFYLRYKKAFEYTGTRKKGKLNFYRIGPKLIGRMARPLDRNRVLTSPEFKGTRFHANLMASASRLVKPYYRALPDGWHCREVYQKMISVAIKSLKADKSAEETECLLGCALRSWGYYEVQVKNINDASLLPQLSVALQEAHKPKTQTAVRSSSCLFTVIYTSKLGKASSNITRWKKKLKMRLSVLDQTNLIGVTARGMLYSRSPYHHRVFLLDIKRTRAG